MPTCKTNGRDIQNISTTNGHGWTRIRKTQFASAACRGEAQRRLERQRRRRFRADYCDRINGNFAPKAVSRCACHRSPKLSSIRGSIFPVAVLLHQLVANLRDGRMIAIPRLWWRTVVFSAMPQIAQWLAGCQAWPVPTRANNNSTCCR